MTIHIHLFRLNKTFVRTAFCLLALCIACGSVDVFAANPVINHAGYEWKSVAIHGGGFVAGIVPHPTAPGLIYARTDVGGAYRWDAESKTWIGITDWISQTDWNLMGCESIAVDPKNPDRVYLALGMYTNSWGQNGAIVRSNDRGKTFERTNVPFKLGGNCPGRSVGERLTVDPNDGRILYFGSRAAGLWKSVDQAKTWNKVDSFPLVATSAASMDVGYNKQWALGISFVKCDAESGRVGSPTPVVYAGVATQETSFFRSTDGGFTWAAVAGQPVGFRPNHMVIAPNGLIYISYGDQIGPNDVNDGAIWQFNPKAGQWLDISPVKPGKGDRFGYGAVTLDAQHLGTLMASSLDRWGHGDAVFRTINGGKTWTSQTVGGPTGRKMMEASDAPWGMSLAAHWLGDIEIDPFDSNHVLFTTGFGIWATHQATSLDSGKPVHWAFEDRGLEETVPTELVSPPSGPHLISAIGDFDGFTHDDLDLSPRSGRHEPSVGTTTALDFAGKLPSRVVRAGGKAAGFYSDDGGESWTAFADHPQAGKGGGEIAISSDGKTIVWLPEGAVTSRSIDLGKTWTRCEGLPRPLRPVADRVDANRFYAFDVESGTMFVSQDGGATFTAGAMGLPKNRGSLRAVFDHAGDLWFAVDDQLYHSEDSGRSFTKITTLDKVKRVGFGKAAPGKNYPALFICGNVRGLEGIFRSDDGARSWVHIDDDQHRFGEINVVVGDPRVYGRVYLGTGGRGIVYGELSRAAD